MQFFGAFCGTHSLVYVVQKLFATCLGKGCGLAGVECELGVNMTWLRCDMLHQNNNVRIAPKFWLMILVQSKPTNGGSKKGRQV